jgi:hypothetical protein
MYLHEYLSFSLCGICQTVSVFNVLKQRKKPYFNDASNHDVIYGNYQAVVATLSLIFTAWLFKPYSCKINNKTEKKYYHTLGTFPNANRKILLIDKIDISNTQRISLGTSVSPPIKLTTTI